MLFIETLNELTKYLCTFAHVFHCTSMYKNDKVIIYD